MKDSQNLNTSSHAGKDETAIYAERLLLANGKTTSKEVEQELRRHGYLVCEADICFFMDELADELDWPYTSKGGLRIFVLAYVEPEWWDNLVNVCTN